MPYADKQKQQEYLQKYHREYHKLRYAQRITEMLVYLGGECVHCGSRENLEFDHIDRRTKSFSITRKWNRKWDILKPELDKCQLLCKECHLSKTKSEHSGK